MLEMSDDGSFDISSTPPPAPVKAAADSSTPPAPPAAASASSSEPEAAAEGSSAADEEEEDNTPPRKYPLSLQKGISSVLAALLLTTRLLSLLPSQSQLLETVVGRTSMSGRRPCRSSPCPCLSLRTRRRSSFQWRLPTSASRWGSKALSQS